MIQGDIQTLAIESVTRPREAAARIIAWGVPMSARWQVVFLMAVLTAATTALSLLVSPPPMRLPLFMTNPILMAAFVVFSMTGVAWLSAAIAPAFGGRGAWQDLLLLFAWVQGLRVIAQAVLIVLSVFPGGTALGGLLGLIASVAGVWISVMFATEALKLSSAWKGLLLLALSGIAVVLLMSVVWALVGPMPEGFTDV